MITTKADDDWILEECVVHLNAAYRQEKTQNNWANVIVGRISLSRSDFRQKVRMNLAGKIHIVSRTPRQAVTNAAYVRLVQVRDK